MIITDRFVVLNMPKTGSTFVRTALRELRHAQLARRSPLARLLDRCGIAMAPKLRELRLPNIRERSGHSTDQHGIWGQIPSRHRAKPVVSVVRNPYDRLLSLYGFRWWVEHPPLDEARLRGLFPTYPELTLEEFLEMRGLELREGWIPHIPLQAEVGPQTVRFIQMFFRDPEAVLRKLDDEYLKSDRFVDDMPEITFLRTENLNGDLHDFLLAQGHDAEEIEFIKTRARVHATRRRDDGGDPPWTENALRSVAHGERLLFRILAHHGLEYPAP